MLFEIHSFPYEIFHLTKNTAFPHLLRRSDIVFGINKVLGGTTELLTNVSVSQHGLQVTNTNMLALYNARPSFSL